MAHLAVVDAPTRQIGAIPGPSELIPYVEPGEYEMVYVGHETALFFGKSPKATFWFRIVEMGDHFGKVIPRFYNVKRFKGKPGRNGQFVPGRSSDFIREFCTLFPDPITRLDRLPITRFKNAVLTGKVRVTRKDHRQKDLPGPLAYSVIDELLGVKN